MYRRSDFNVVSSVKVCEQRDCKRQDNMSTNVYVLYDSQIEKSEMYYY